MGGQIAYTWLNTGGSAMGQVAFDTQEFVEKLESSGLNREQAKAITLVVRQSHEVADLATKRDLEDVRKDLKAVIQNHDAQLPICFEKTESKIMDVRKDFTIQLTDIRRDMDARFEKNEAQMQARFEKTDAQIADVRKDMTAGFDKINDKFETLGMQMTIRLGLMVAAAVSIIAAILKM
ncbi:DUF1640 domain-containing protein [Symbiopectobacterium sp. Eva_TO]